MESGSTRLRLVETESGWELREPGREKPLRRVSDRARGQRIARTMLELRKGGCVEVLSADGVSEPYLVEPMSPKQRRWIVNPFPRISIALAFFWLALLVAELVSMVVDGALPWHQILVTVIAAVSAIMYGGSSLLMLRHQRRPL